MSWQMRDVDYFNEITSFCLNKRHAFFVLHNTQMSKNPQIREKETHTHTHTRHPGKRYRDYDGDGKRWIWRHDFSINGFIKRNA